MRKSSSVRRVFVPPINTGHLPSSQNSHRVVAPPLHEQASQTLKFCPSKESMQVKYRTTGAPPLPNRGSKLNSERGFRENPRLVPISQQAAGGVRYSHRQQRAAEDNIVVKEHYQSTEIGENVIMMFDPEQSQ